MGNILKNILDKPWLIFAIIAFIFGSIILFLTPKYEVPDDIAHLYRVCEVADGVFYNKYPADKTHYDKILNIIVPRDESNFHLASRNSPIMYFAPAIALKFFSLFTQNDNILYYICRFANLLVYILFCTFAIKITPVFKYQFLFISLLPMALFEGMSFSADSFNNGFAFLFFAFLFKLIFEKKEVTKKDFFILIVFSIIGAFCKGLIYPTFLLFFLPKLSLDSKYHNKCIYIFSLILLSSLISFIWMSINYKNLNPNIVAINNIFYIIKEPFHVLKLILYTTIENYHFYLKGAIGILGVLAIHLPSYIYNSVLLIFISMFFVFYEKTKIKMKITALLIFVLFYFIIQYVQLIYWNSIDTNIIQGFQGRYLLSMMPLCFLFMPCCKLSLSSKFKNLYKFFIIFFLIFILSLSCSIIYEYYYILGIGV